MEQTLTACSPELISLVAWTSIPWAEEVRILWEGDLACWAALELCLTWEVVVEVVYHPSLVRDQTRLLARPMLALLAPILPLVFPRPMVLLPAPF